MLLLPLLAGADDAAKRLFELGGSLLSGRLPSAPAGGTAGGNDGGGLPVAGAGAGASGAPAPGCPRLGRLSSIGAVGPRPESYEPAVLWPANAHCEVHEFRDLRFPRAEAEKKAFSKTGEVPCKRCEHGFHFDDWPRNMPESRLLQLNPGRPLTWKGARYQGAVVLTGEHPIGSFPCRQYRWTLTEGGQVAAERHGLFCRYTIPGSSSAQWYQVI